MNTVFAILAGLCLLEGAYVWLFMRHDGYRRWAVPFGLIAIFVAQSGLTISAMGKPRPAWTMAGWGGQMELGAITWVEGSGFYLWLNPLEGGEPLSLSLPWNPQSAEQTVEDAMTLFSLDQFPNVDTGQLTFGWGDDESVVDQPYPAPIPPKQGE